MTHLLVRAAGPMTSIQDRGRFGWQRYGVTTSGTLDPLALAAANALVGNPAGTAAIEILLVGATFTAVDGPVRVALAGADCPLLLDGETLPSHTSVTVPAGATLTVGTARTGTVALLAVQGGFDIAPQLGSLSLHARSGIGGLNGRALQAGDVLPLRVAAPSPRPEMECDRLRLGTGEPLRVVLGPQHDHFEPAAVDIFLGATYRVTPEADRMGFRLTGPRVAPAKTANIVSDGIVPGSVQVPGGGEPIVMLADRQTTGGYPKIATVITPDLRKLAQRRVGETLRFIAVDMEEAQDLAAAYAAEIAGQGEAVRPARGPLSASEDLLGENLAGRAVNAQDTGTWSADLDDSPI